MCWVDIHVYSTYAHVKVSGEEGEGARTLRL